ncbi:hypothetical protein ACOME3_003743 [Neoechinorhynchus agilis]
MENDSNSLCSTESTISVLPISGSQSPSLFARGPLMRGLTDHPPINHHDSHLRWFALILMCTAALGSSYCFDSPAALQEYMLRDLHISSTIFTLFYSLYSWPNVILCLFGGMFVDKLGRQISVVAFCAMILLGQMLFATGAYFRRIWLMFAGRVIFGMGAESQGTAMSTYLTHFFLDKELNLAFGVQLSFGRAGSSINMYATKPLYDQVNRWFPYLDNGAKSLGITLYLIGLLCAVSLIAVIILALVDYKSNRSLNSVPEVQQMQSPSFREMLSLPLELWLLAFVCLFYYISIFPFISVGIKFFRNRFKVSNRMASALVSFVMLFSAVLAPFLGVMNDRIGRNLCFIMFSIIGTLISHCFLAFTFISPVFTMILFSVSYSVMTAFLWPLIVVIASEKQTGTAFGMTLSIQNSGLAIMNMVSGYILDNYGYLDLQIIMIANLLFCFAFSLALYHVDETRGIFLNLSSKQRNEVRSFRQSLDPNLS